MSGTNKSQHSGWWLPALALLWSEGIFYSKLYQDELLMYIGGMFGFLLMFWYLFGFGFIAAAILRKDRWALVALLMLPLGFVQAGQIDYKALSERRWQAIRPKLEAQLTEALRTSLPNKTKESYSVIVLKSEARVVTDASGHCRVAFVQYRISIDNGLAYVYDHSDSLHVEMGRSSDGLGNYLSGFGEIARVEPLGNHWYRC